MPKIDLNHFKRATYCKGDFWCEPGARNVRSEFHLWLHLECRLPSFFIVPWPFATAAPRPRGSLIDGDMLLAHWNISGFENWPGEWWNMRQHLTTCMQGQRGIGGFPAGEFWWGLFGTPARNQLAYTPEYAVPKEFINALIGPSKAGR